MEQRAAKYWKIAKLTFGSVLAAGAAAGAALLWWMSTVRDDAAYPEGGLFIARTMAAAPMAACLVTAAWCFASLRLRMKAGPLRRAATGAAIVCGAADIALAAYCYGTVIKYLGSIPGP